MVRSHWAGSSTGAVSQDDSTEVMCLVTEMGKFITTSHSRSQHLSNAVIICLVSD